MAQRFVIVGISGSIAAYKSPELVRLLQKQNRSVRVAMTSSAERFVGTLTFEGLTGAPVYANPLAIPATRSGKSGIVHTDLSEIAAALVIAPATANIIAKLAHGLANDAVTTLALALQPDAPLVIAPAMNPRMWNHPAVRENVATLRRRGTVIVGPGRGETACGDLGTGRMSEPDEIAAQTARAISLAQNSNRWPRRILILSGPTREYLDDVRFLSNGSTGKMGRALAEAAYESGADVTVVSGPAAVPIPGWIQTIRVESADQMLRAAEGLEYDLLLSPAAIADYRPAARATGKPEKSETFASEFTRNPDLLATLAAHRDPARPATVVAFAAEERDDLIDKALAKGTRKSADYIVLNAAITATGADDTFVRLIHVTSGRVTEIGPASKRKAARKLLEEICVGQQATEELNELDDYK